MKILDTLKSMVFTKRGVANGIGGMKAGLVAVLVIVLLVNLAPTAFQAIYDMNTTILPTWFKTVMNILVAITLIFIVLKQVD